MPDRQSPPQVPIAVVGVSALFPGSVDKDGFWRDILAGRDLVGDVPASHWLIEDYYDPDMSKPDKTYAKRGAFLGEVPFDPVEFGVPPSIVPATDTSQLLALIVAHKVLEDAANGDYKHIDRERMSVILGVTGGQELLSEMTSRLQRPVWVKALRESGIPEEEVQAICDRISASYVPWQEATFPGLLGNVVAGRIANRFDLHGTNAITDAACASSLSALSMGVNELALHQSDFAIVGGVDTMNDIFMYMCFSKTPALSKTGDCRPFSSTADGTLLGEGLGMVALRRLDDAERDGNRIYAVIRGLGSSSDGRGSSVYAPVPSGQARALRRCYESADWSPGTVELIEAHGTGTVAGDAAEFEALRQVFDPTRDERQFIALGSVKSQIGHTKSSAGAAGLFKAVMALHHKVLPPTIKIEKPNPKMKLDQSAFYLNTSARPWVRPSDHPRRAGLSSFGFGGTNFHVGIEEYTGPNRAQLVRTFPSELVLLAAEDGAGLVAKARKLASETVDLATAAYQSIGAAGAHRLAIVASDVADLKAKLEDAASRVSAAVGQAFTLPTGVAYGAGALEGRIALLFPGQGSQYLNMGADLAMAFSEALAAWDLAADVAFDAKERLADVVFPKPVYDDPSRGAQQARLMATEWAQPGLGVASHATLEVLSKFGVKGDAFAGHSFGEVTALFAAGSLSEADFVRTARARGEAMRDAAKIPGAMTAVAKPIEEVRSLLEQWKVPVVIANHNHPSQVVLSGPTDAIDDVEGRLQAAGITAKRLSVATAFHSPVVSDATKKFSEFLGDVAFEGPRGSVFANATAAPYPATGPDIRAQLGGQLAQPVRFVEEIEAMYAAGVRTFIEVGPSAVLTDLASRILGDRPHVAVPTDRKGKNGVVSLFLALGRLFAAGVPVDLGAAWDGYAPPAPPKKKAAFTLNINGANYGKPYPPPGGAAALPKPNPPKPPPEPIYIEVPVPVPAAHVEDMMAKDDRNTTPMAANAEAQLAWVRAYQDAQRATAEAHAAYQRAMAESHLAFLRTVETSFTGLSSMIGGNPVELAPMTAPALAPQLTLPAPAPAPERPAPPPTIARPVPSSPPAPAAAVPAPAAAPKPAVPKPAAPAAKPAAPAAKPATQDLDLNALMLSVVAEKTGYPAEMLGMHMELEGDLGIDSIKRVEILSTMRERAPSLPEVDGNEMAQLRTLGQIVDYMGSKSGAPTPKPAAPAQKPAPAAPPSLDLNGLMLSVVAEKTGYPAEMLGMHMELEGDLGIDSIKRVEILSTMRERAPSLPEVDGNEMAQLRTLGQIVDYMAKKGGMAASGPSTNGAAPVNGAAKPANGLDLQALMLSVVAEKTGYPAEMLGLHMELEGDLGIDSIKRVEILSSMRERAPSLPEVDANEMAQLRTLGQIVDYMRANGAGAASTSGTPSPMVSLPGEVAPSNDVLDATDSASGIARYAVGLVDAPAPGLAMAGVHAAKWVITSDGRGIAESVAGFLRTHGIEASIVSSVPADATAVLLLDGLADLKTVDAAIAVNRAAFRQIRGSGLSKGGLLVVAQDTGGDFGFGGTEPIRAWSAGIAAMARTAALEWPDVGVKALDIATRGLPAQLVAERIVAEILTGGATLEVAIDAAGARRSVEATPTKVTVDGDGPGPTDVIVASGGARGVTAETLVALAGRSKSRFVLLGRTALADEPAACRGVADEPGLKRALMLDAQQRGEKVTPMDVGRKAQAVLAAREVLRTIARIREAGGDARYLPVDVQDAPKLKAALDPVRKEWGPVTGVLHGAGVLADKKITDKTDAQFDLVFDTKIAGLRAMLAATADDPVDLLVLFSSVAARSGNVGQVDYAMANEILNKIAHTERRRGIRAKSIGWGPWQGGMVTPALAQHFASMGVALIPLDHGARRLVDEVRGSLDEVEIVVGGGLGEGPLGAAVEPKVSLEARVDAKSYPYLRDHVVGDKAVVPVATVLDWFAAAAQAVRPDLHLGPIRDLKVLRGIRVDLDRGETLRVTARQLSNGNGAVVGLEVRGAKDALHYSATADLLEASPTAPRPRSTPSLPAFDGVIYDGHTLFHGPAFQVVDTVDGASDEAFTAVFSGVNAKGWPGTFSTDPAVVDGALQLALLWTDRALGGASLPMGCASVQIWRPGPVSGPVRAILHGRKTTSDRGVCDIALVDEAGHAIADLRGVETVRRPGEAARS